MIIATFNINGIKARMPALLDWLGERRPDVALLQEIKSQDDAFPSEPIEDLGYQVETHGQKGFNGVAICSRLPIEDVKRGLPGDPDDEQARWMEASVSGEKGAVSVCCLYLPNGNPAPGPKFDYKLAWMERMKRRAEALLELEEPLVMAGDYNVIQQPEDCWDETEWAEDALYMMETRTAFQRNSQPWIHRRSERQGRFIWQLHVLGLPGRPMEAESRNSHRPHAAVASSGRQARRLPG